MNPEYRTAYNNEVYTPQSDDAQRVYSALSDITDMAYGLIGGVGFVKSVPSKVAGTVDTSDAIRLVADIVTPEPNSKSTANAFLGVVGENASDEVGEDVSERVIKAVAGSRLFQAATDVDAEEMSSLYKKYTSHHVREYRYAYWAVEPLTGEHFFLVLPYANTVCMNLFLKELSEKYHDDMILLGVDGAAWHKSKALELPDNIQLFVLLPYTPEMNPIEQIWKEIRKRGFKNEIFHMLEKVVDRLCHTINSLTSDTIKSITGREWLLSIF